MLPKDIAKLVPKTHLMSESEWRNLGVQQSQGWVHYMIHEPEPHILLFRRPLPKKPKKWSCWTNFQPKLFPAVLPSYRLSDSMVMLLSYFSLWRLKDVRSIHFLNVLVPPLLLDLSHQCHNPSDECDLRDLVCAVSSRPYLPSLRSVWKIRSWLLTGMVWICCCAFYYWVLYLWWLRDLRFNVLGTFHFIWQISSVLQALIKGSFLSSKAVVTRLSYPYVIVYFPPPIASEPPTVLQPRWYSGTVLILKGGWWILAPCSNEAQLDIAITIV